MSLFRPQIHGGHLSNDRNPTRSLLADDLEVYWARHHGRHPYILGSEYDTEESHLLGVEW